MGCVNSSDKSTRSCYRKRFWINRSKKNYNVNSTPVQGHISPPKSILPVMTRTTDILSICDDFQEGNDEDKSYGYFSESISTANTSELSFNANDCDLKMEMYMMTRISKVMPKTSSPILAVKYPSRHFPALEDKQPEQQQSSYSKWERHLQRTPPYVLNNVSQIPEAIAGQFTPEGFPGYTDVRRFKCDTMQSRPQSRPYAVRC